jgi:pimeloyl-ACP methyl ester carboxylesterase
MRDRDQFIEHDGVRLRYRVEGSGPTIVLIHGWALDLDMWRPQFAAFRDHYQVAAFDRRGFGQSTGQPSIADDLRDFAFMLGELNVQHAALIGMSQGARVALRCALQMPQLVTCLLLDGPPHESATQGPDDAEQPPMTAYRALAQRDGIAAVREAWAQHPLMQLRTRDRSTHALLEKMIARYPGNDLLSAASERLTSVDNPRSLRAPTLVINGKFDSARRLAAGEAMAPLLPHARRSVVPDAGHLPNLDNPIAYNDLVREFLHAHTDLPRRASAS